MERFLAGGADGRVLFIARGAVESVVAVSERPVDQISFALGADETLLMPVLVLEAHVLYSKQVIFY